MAKEKYEGVYLPPTPEIGETVQWFPHADQAEAPCAATVTRIDQPGMVTLVRHPPGQNYPLSIGGVRWVGDPIHIEQGVVTIENGGWDFISIPADRQLLAKREFDRKAAMRASADYQERLAREAKRDLMKEPVSV